MESKQSNGEQSVEGPCIVGTCPCGGYGVLYDEAVMERCHDEQSAFSARPLTVQEVAEKRRKTLGRTVERMMDARQMTYRDAAKAFGITKSAIFKIVRGDVDAQSSTIWAIADFFSVSLDELYGGESGRRLHEVLQNDVRDLLLACGLSDHARACSPHEVVQREVIPAIRRLRATQNTPTPDSSVKDVGTVDRIGSAQAE